MSEISIQVPVNIYYWYISLFDIRKYFTQVPDDVANGRRPNLSSLSDLSVPWRQVLSRVDGWFVAANRNEGGYEEQLARSTIAGVFL